MNRRELFLASASVAISSFTNLVFASEQPIKLVVPNGPGTPTDAAARAAIPHLEKSLKRTIIIEYKPGATGNLAAAYVARSKPDGNTLLMGTIATNAINHHVYSKMQFDPSTDFTPITQVMQALMAVAVHPSVPANNLQELIEYAKNASIPVSYGTAGIGSPHHLAGELLAKKANIKINHIPYPSTAKSILDLLGGNIEMAFVSLSAALPLHKEGKVKVIAMTESERNYILPEIPTIGESIPGFSFSVWQGLFAPANTPQNIVKVLEKSFHEAFSKPEVKEVLEKQAVLVSLSNSEDFAKYVQEEQKRWGIFVKDMKISAS